MTERNTAQILEEYQGQTVAGRKVTIYEQHVEIELPSGLTKTISIADFTSALSLSINMEEELKGYHLPAGCFHIASSIKEVKVCCYYPGKLRKMQYAYWDQKKNGELIVPFPNIVISHKLVKKGNVIEWTDSRYFATSKSVGQLPLKYIWEQNQQDQLWYLPFTNIYNNGRMCYGGNTVPRQFTDNLHGLDWHFAVLYNSPFNDDLGIKGTNQSWTPANWYIQLTKHKVFPYELLKYGKKPIESKSVAADISSRVEDTDDIPF